LCRLVLRDRLHADGWNVSMIDTMEEIDGRSIDEDRRYECTKKQSATTMDAEGLKEGIGFVPIKDRVKDMTCVVICGLECVSVRTRRSVCVGSSEEPNNEAIGVDRIDTSCQRRRPVRL